MPSACSIRVRGVVQGVGFRPFVYRLAHANTLAGWVLNAEAGVEIHLEGTDQGMDEFLRALKRQPPPAASITAIEVLPAEPVGYSAFTIRESERHDHPTVCISPDLPVCEECLLELFDPRNPRYGYPYINCTNCGPRYTVIQGLPYDRPNTTMAPWNLDDYCSAEYHDPGNRRFHAQPVACPACGPSYVLHPAQEGKASRDQDIIQQAAALLREGKILAIKGIGGYHLACDGWNATSVLALRDRKYRKEKPFALMVRDLEVARTLVELSPSAEALLGSVARPIVLAPARLALPGVAPDNHELGLMLPYTPLHHLLFAAGAPAFLVMTSANRSSEPIAYQDDDAQQQLAGIADAFLVGQRPIARRVDDSVVRQGACGPAVLRRARGYAPGAVAAIPSEHPILAVGSDLKNAITLVVAGQAFVSQHIGDLDHYRSFQAFEETIEDLLSMYEVRRDDLRIVSDLHPQFHSTAYAETLAARYNGVVYTVQHHRAHIASVLAECGEWEKRVVGICCDGTGYGDDGAIWGCEVFVGSVRQGFERVAHLRSAALPGGDAAAQNPVQAAAGFLAQLPAGRLQNLTNVPFHFPARYRNAAQLIQSGVRTFTTTSMGRLFDTAAALTGFIRPSTFEGQAAMWLEQIARKARNTAAYPFPYTDGELDFRPLLQCVLEDRIRGRDAGDIARAFHRGVAHGLAEAAIAACHAHGLDTVVLSGGVFQNELLLEEMKSLLEAAPLQVWINHAVPPNDGGISLGQAALAAFASATEYQGGECTNSLSQ